MVVAFDAVAVVVIVAEDKRHETVTSFAVYGARLQKMERG